MCKGYAYSSTFMASGIHGPALVEHSVFSMIALITAQPAMWSTDIQRLKKPDATG